MSLASRAVPVATHSVNATAIAVHGMSVFDTDNLDEGDRLDAWHEHLAKNFATFDFGVAANDDFYGRLETVNLGPVRINRSDCSAAHWSRQARHLADGCDDYNLCVAVSGSYRFIQGGVDIMQEPCSFTLIDNGRPHEAYAGSSGVNYDITMPRQALRCTQRAKGQWEPPILNLNGPSMRLLHTYVNSIFRSQDDFEDPVLCAKMGEHLLDLITLGLRPTPDAEQQASTRGLRAARLNAILSAIGKNFCDPAIRAESIASSVNLSERYLHKLLEERGLLFSHIVLDLRLNKARNLLSDPRHDHLRIGEIAYDCGFNDLSYFNRCFKTRFGDTPGVTRKGSAATALM